MSTSVDKRLYGRSQQVAFLREWHTSVVPTFRCPLLLLGGPKGIGKGTLAKSLVPHVQAKNGLFVSGRCYAPRSNEGKCPPDRPLRAVWDALDTMFDHVKTPLQRSELKSAILAEFRDYDDAETLMEMMPSSRRLLQGEEYEKLKNESLLFTGSTMKVPPFVKSKRLLNESSGELVVRFLRSIAVSVPNLVLCLEHLDAADSATFDLLETFLDDSSVRGLFLLIATFRDDNGLSPAMVNLMSHAKEVTFDEPNYRYAVFAAASSQIPRITVANLQWEDVYQFAVDSLSRESLSEDMMHSLVDLAHEKSLGNPQFLWYIFRYFVTGLVLNEQDLCTMHDTIPNRIEDVYARILESLNPGTIALIETVAALGECSGGESIDHETLNLLLRRSCTNDILAAQTNGIFDSDDIRIRFVSDEFQSLVYSMISESRRATLHLKLARRLWAKRTSTEDDQEEILKHDEFDPLFFLGAQNLQLGMGLVSDMGELDAIAEISIEAGQRAMRLSMFSFAAFYFELAISAVGDLIWKADWYDVSLALYNGVSEVYYCSTDFDAMERAVEIVIQNGRTFQDKMQAYTTRVYAKGAKQRLEESIVLAADVLREVGETFPLNPSMFRVLREYYNVRILFRGKSDRYFLSLPAATNPEKVTAIRMMSFVSFTAYYVNPPLSLFMIFRILRTIMAHGVSGPVITAMATYAVVISTHMGRINEGTRFANLALSFLERGEGLAWLPRVHFMVYGLLNRSRLPLRESLEPLRKASHIAMKAGDMEGSAMASFGYATNLFHSGANLGAVQDELRVRIKLMSRLGQEGGVVMLIYIWQVICDMKGGAPCPLNLVGEITDATSAFHSAKKANNSYALETYYVWQTMYLCLIGKFQASLEMTKEILDGKMNVVWLTFFEGMSSLAISWDAVGVSRWRKMIKGRQAAKSMKDTTRYCVDNFGSKQALLEAEIAALEGKAAKAFSLYDASINFAKDQGFLLEEGFAYERLGHFHCTLGSLQATQFYESARDAYERWGAQTMVSRMEEQLTMLVDEDVRR